MAVKQTNPVAPTSGTRVIAIVDPSRPRFLELSKLLTESSFRLEFIDTKANYVQKVVELKPELVIMNLFMNNSSTLPAVRQIKEALARLNTKVIVITGHQSINNLRESIKAGADDFILEPFDSRLVLQRIRYQLQEREVYSPDDLNAESTQVLAGFTLVYEILKTLSEVKDHHRSVFDSLRKVADLARSPRVNVMEGDLETNRGAVLSSSDDPDLTELPVDLEKYPEVREVLLNGNIVYIKDITNNPLTKDVKAAVKSISINSILVFPIRHRNETLGSLNIRLGDQSNLDVTDKHLKTFYMVALALGPKIAERKLLKKASLQAKPSAD
jgi:DNA-binding response OmpR family regulator